MYPFNTKLKNLFLVHSFTYTMSLMSDVETQRMSCLWKFPAYSPPPLYVYEVSVWCVLGDFKSPHFIWSSYNSAGVSAKGEE